nr:MAG TPA: hypothetical protein [Caudoviricetes sp.]
MEPRGIGTIFLTFPQIAKRCQINVCSVPNISSKCQFHGTFTEPRNKYGTTKGAIFSSTFCCSY